MLCDYNDKDTNLDSLDNCLGGDEIECIEDYIIEVN